MTFNYRMSRRIALGALALLVAAGGALAAAVGGEHIVAQHGRHFDPRDVYLRPGERIVLVNDDGAFIHHPYIDAPGFAYDSGDIEPGGRAVVAFPRPGDYTVLCGIHPKMKLTVHAQ